MRSIVASTCAGWRPTAVSPESITASTASKMAFATSEASARVGRRRLGHRLEHLCGHDHAACLRCALPRRCGAARREPASSGSSTPEVAAGDHHGVGGLDDRVELDHRLVLLDLRHDRDDALPHRSPQPDDVFGRTHERLRDHIDARIERPGEEFEVPGGDAVHAEPDARHVHALAARERAADTHGRVHHARAPCRSPRARSDRRR